MHALIQRALSQGRNLLEPEALMLLAEYGLPLPEHRWIGPGQPCLCQGEEPGPAWPLVLKTVSRDILHKSEVGGVRLGLANPEQLARAQREMRADLDAKAPGWRDDGCLLVSQAPAGLELIAGVLADPQFGPCLMLGLGGVLAEAVRDVCFRVLPVSPVDLAEMIAELKGQRLLNGFRGAEPLDRQMLIDCLMGLSRMCLENPCMVECDLNPIIWSAGRLTVADARIVLAAQDGEALGHA